MAYRLRRRVGSGEELTGGQIAMDYLANLIPLFGKNALYFELIISLAEKDPSVNTMVRANFLQILARFENQRVHKISLVAV
jgi:hypothetical protein